MSSDIDSVVEMLVVGSSGGLTVAYIMPSLPAAVPHRDAFALDAFGFNFMDSQLPTLDTFSTAGLSNTWELPDISGMGFDEQFMSMISGLSAEQIQYMLDYLTPPDMQEVPSQIYVPTNDIILQQPTATIPSQAPIGSEPIDRPAEAPLPTTSRSRGCSGTTLLTAITLLRLNVRFNPLFRSMGLASCPDKIDLKAGMEQEDAMIAAGYLPQTHVPWEEAIKLLGKQGFRSYYYSEIEIAKANNTELPPVPEWIRRYCLSKDTRNAPARISNQDCTTNPLNKKPKAAKMISRRNNPTEQPAFVWGQNKGKGNSVSTQRYSPYARQ
ncbi:hypothetical protein RhiXN_07267 [Rhizoctonia solani]|uniref:Uncharacterized protein n=1 Tax=Rhizoctonia solani TaxID=456999 RepID=A0A8H8T296_9AGAM|nr:uncharacterized protein RhiXN_07267 [Rhizoctonia solani]QRW25318.1 hypothetical protein RhiXN_07267 [Rhizoctonia solani]